MTIGDLSKLANFSIFCKAIAFGFFAAKKSTVESAVVGLGGDSLGREESLEPIRTTVGRKLPSAERFEVSVITVENELVRASPASFEARFQDESSWNRVPPFEFCRQTRVS